jgi:hypothetical protein
MYRQPCGASDVIAIMAPGEHVLQIRFYYGSGITSIDAFDNCGEHRAAPFLRS